MSSARDLMVIDEKGNEHVEIDLADIDAALAGVRTVAPQGFTGADCYEIYKEWIKGKSPYEIDRERRLAGLRPGIKGIVAAIQFIRYKVGLSIDPQVEQHKSVAFAKMIIGGLAEQLHEGAKTVETINKVKRQFEDEICSVVIKDLTQEEKTAFLSLLGLFSSILDLRQKEVRTMTALTSQIATYNTQLSVLTGANITAKKTANKQKVRTLEDKLDNYDDATLHRLIEGFKEEVEQEFAPDQPNTD